MEFIPRKEALVFRQKHIALFRPVRSVNATEGIGLWCVWVEAYQAVCLPDGSGVGRQAACGGCSQNITAEATRRLEILKFWDKHGVAATLDAYKVSRRTLYRWKQLYRSASGKITALSNQSRAPKRRRVRQWPAEILTRLKELRLSYPSLGAEKLQLFLADWCGPRKLPCPAARTVMRLIAERAELKKAKPPRLKVAHRKTVHPRKPKGFTATYPGQCVGVDTIEIQRDGQRRYTSTFTDINSRAAAAVAITSGLPMSFIGLAEWLVVLSAPTRAANGQRYCGGFPKHVSLIKLKGCCRITVASSKPHLMPRWRKMG